MDKMVLGYPYPKRKDIIRNFHDNNIKYKRPLKFMRDIDLRNVYEVSIDMPKYRLANGRTQSSQEKYLAASNQNLPSDFFERDLESEEKHQIQHGILKELLKDKSIDLIQFFSKAKQEEPIIIDEDGFVINGNRRLCAMRELYYSDKELYERFKFIDVLLLPPCEEQDKDELEANLQIKQDIKADYSWITQACMFRKRQRDYKYTDKELAKIYDMKESEVRELLDMLGYADEYLDSRKITKLYDDVEKKQFGFKQIRKFNDDNKTIDISEKDVFKNVTYCMLDENAEDLGLGRIYSAINDLGKYFDDVKEALILELPLDNYHLDEEYDDQLVLFDGIANSPDQKKICSRLALAVGDQENNEEIIAIVKDVIERKRILDSDDKTARFVIKQIGKAHSLLNDAINHFDDETEINGISEQLDSVELLIQQLRRKVEQPC